MSRRLAIVLAAGKGTRMKSELPKVLIPVLGRPMLEYVLDTLDACGVDDSIVVVGYRKELVEAAVGGRPNVSFVEQTEQRGTGHAVMMCRDRLTEHDGPVIVVAGDSPMLRSESLARLLDEYDNGRPACILGTASKSDPQGLGRIVRDETGQFAAIVEEKDADPRQRQITEVNLSCYVFDCQELLHSFGQLKAENKQQEYYLTDCPSILMAAGKEVRALNILHASEALSINTMDELSIVESAMTAASAP